MRCIKKLTLPHMLDLSFAETITCFFYTGLRCACNMMALKVPREHTHKKRAFCLLFIGKTSDKV